MEVRNMRTTLICVGVAAALAVGAWAQLSGTNKSADKAKQHTFQVLVDNKVVSSGVLAPGQSKSVKVLIDGKTVIEGSAGGGSSHMKVSRSEGGGTSSSAGGGGGGGMSGGNSSGGGGASGGGGSSTMSGGGNSGDVMGSINAPTVVFQEDGSYKVMYRDKVLAEGQVDKQGSRSVSVTVTNGKYKVEVNGQIVAEGDLPQE
jgi:hypothetical protein